MNRLTKFITPFSKLSKGDKSRLVEEIRKDRQTSKAILKKTTKKQRVNAMSKLEQMMASMSEEDRIKFLKSLGG